MVSGSSWFLCHLSKSEKGLSIATPLVFLYCAEVDNGTRSTAKIKIPFKELDNLRSKSFSYSIMNDLTIFDI
jgi:hypothetical protein